MFKSDAARTRYMAAYDAMLRDWPVAYEELDLPTRLGTTHVIASGPLDAPPLVMLPCWQGTATVWRPNVEGLSQHFRIYAVDVIGQPGKSVANRRIRSRRDYADWFTDLLDGLGVQRTSIVGNSYGGFLALSQASLTPERVDRVVLISPSGTFVSYIWKHLYVMLRMGFWQLTRNKHGADVFSFFFRNIQFDPRDAGWLALMALAVSESRMRDASGIVPTVFAKAELRGIRARTLMLVGDEEVIYEPYATLRRARDRMPGLEGDIVANAHHIAAMAKPDDINARIKQFLQRSV
jgi:pimeloyl-ACP methyl ester carboxylesterase